MFKGKPDFLLPVLFFSMGALATSPGDESSQIQFDLKDKRMDFCSESLRERPQIQNLNLLKQYNQELGGIAQEARKMNSFPDVGDPTFRLEYDKKNDLVEIFPGGRRDSDATPMLVVRASQLEPAKLARIKDAGGLHVEEIAGDGAGQVAILGPGGTSPALVKLLTDNLNLFCVKANKKSGGVARTDILGDALNALISEEGAFVGEAVVSEPVKEERKKPKLGGAHRRH